MARMVLTAGFDYGDYYIQSLLGKGAMAEVYLATDRQNGKNVALKVLPRGFGNADARVRRFEREAHAMTSTKHPNVVAIYEVGKYNRTPFIAMEYIDGPTLREVLDAGSLTPEHAFDLARQMAEGLAAAHHCGIVHRDLKPENVMISSDGEVKILDFGPSKPLSQCSVDSAESHEVLTLPGTILGTLEYMSREQASGEPVDERADQFAFGAILYEMLTGTGAFHHQSAARVLAAVIEGEPEPLGIDVPEALRQIVTRSLEKDPAKRFDTMEELLGALQNAETPSPWLAVGSIVLAALAAALFI